MKISSDLPLPKWPKVQLKHVADHCLGKMLDAQKNKGKLLPYLRNPNVRWFDVDTTELKMMPFEDHEADRYGLQTGDVVICEGGEAGRAAIWDGRIPGVMFQKAIHRVRPHKNLDGRFLVHRLMADYFNGTLADYHTGATIKHFTGQDLARYTFELPPITEQRRIAAILDQADALRAKRREALAELDGLAQAIFVEMFGDPLENTKQWPILAMAELFSESPNFGTMIPAKSEGGKWLCLRVANIQHWEIDLSDKKYVDLPEETWHRHEAQEGDLLMARAIATQEHLGKCIIAHPKSELWAFDSHLMRLRFNKEKSLPEYIRQMLRTPGGRALFLKASRKSSIQYNINTKEMSALRIPIPPIAIQQEFILRIQALESLKATHRTALTELDALFASLQHRAFRGEL